MTKSKIFRNQLMATAALVLVYLSPAAHGAHHGHHGMMAHPHMARLGVMLANIPFQELESLKLEYGVRVGRVLPGSPAADAGLQDGDIITDIGEHPVYSAERLQWLVHRATAGATLSIRFSRDGALKTVDAKLSTGSTQRAAQAHPSPARTVMGVAMQSMNAGLREYFGAPANVGVLVVEVKQDSPAATAGINVGDVIVKLESTPITTSADVHRVLDTLKPGTPISVEILRKNASQTITVSPEANPKQWRHGHYDKG